MTLGDAPGVRTREIKGKDPQGGHQDSTEGAETMEFPSLLLCKGLLLTGEASPGVVWGGGSDRKGGHCFRLRGEDTGRNLGCSGGCSQGARSVQRGRKARSFFI